MKALVAGATGYTGQEIVDLLIERGDEVVAHIRPNSSKLETFSERFEKAGATVDTSPWEQEAIVEALKKHTPDVVFATLGTTRARKSAADDKEMETYHAVDYGLTVMLAGACIDAEIKPRFVYLSATGVSESSLSEYMRARWQAETYIRHSELPFVFARPAFISGSDREEFRAGERFASVTADALLGMASAIGFVGLRNKYASMTGRQLAEAMVEAASDPACENRVLEPNDLRRLATS